MEIVRRFIIFQTGIYFWGAEMHCVKEIVKSIPMEKCTNPFSEIVGMLNMEDGIIPVVDLHKNFYMEYLPVCGDVCYVIFISGEKQIAVPVFSLNLLLKEIEEKSIGLRINEEDTHQ
ncbi:MAG: chemotaxis protein CheW [Eubacterium sp.]|nr:chemotaxis protein CheW [Eubacterium sp.]